MRKLTIIVEVKMWVASRFPGDDWTSVMWIQHDMYGPFLWELFDIARRKYIDAERTLGVNTVSGILVKPEDGFDHRVLQDAHDMIAARFRFLNQDRMHPELPFEGQKDDRKRIEGLWRDYWRTEIDRLTNIPLFTKAVVTAIAFQNTDVGYTAENDIKRILYEEYNREIRAD